MVTIVGQTTNLWLIRYGAIPEVARFSVHADLEFRRGARVVVRSPRGLEMGLVLQAAPSSSIEENDLQVDRIATADDEAAYARNAEECRASFGAWQQRLREWKLDLELIDLEWTLDRDKLIFYVLSGRGPETTKLAIFAATIGYARVEVQPVGAAGLVPISGGGGCGCGDGGCHS